MTYGPLRGSERILDAVYIALVHCNTLRGSLFQSPRSSAMAPHALFLSILTLALLPGNLALKPEIRADTNRDGVVDVTGTSDLDGKDAWTDQRGAIFLPNIGDSLGRCYTVDRTGQPLSDDELALCNDASGNTAVSSEYLAALRTLPLGNATDKVFAHVGAHPTKIAQHVRLFWKQGASWTYIDPEFRFNATAIRNGLELGIDSRQPVSDSEVWDGTVQIRFTVTDLNRTEIDTVALKVAPVLTHHHLQQVEQLVTVLTNTSEAPQRQFVAELDEARIKANVTKPLLKLSSYDDIWAQDFMEPAFCSMPGPQGRPISIRVLLRSAQSTRQAGRQAFETLRGKGVGAFQPTGPGAFGFREINSGGNIETIPPYTSAKTGRRYAAGRVVTGKHHEELPADAMLTFLRSQGLQDPLILETGWLAIGHVDEFLSFLPADNALGFTVSVADTRSALDVLRKANETGHGDARAYSKTALPDQGGDGSFSPNLNVTIAEVLGDENVVRAQEYAQHYIDANVAILLEETGLNETDLVRIPMLFERSPSFFDGGFSPFDPDGNPQHYSPPPPGGMVLTSFYPAVINGVVLGHSYIGARSFGPVIDGKDVFQEAVEAAYEQAGMDAYFIDDFFSHHVNGGDVHCGSNSLRETDTKWWE